MKKISSSYKISNKIDKELVRKLTESDNENVLSLSSSIISSFETIGSDSSKQNGSLRKIESNLDAIYSNIALIKKQINFGDTKATKVYTRLNEMIGMTNARVESDRKKIKKTVTAWKNTTSGTSNVG